MHILDCQPIANYANLFQLDEHHLVSELQGLKLEQERSNYPDVLRIHPLRCCIEPANGEIITFTAYRVCMTAPGKAEKPASEAVWSQRAATVMRATGGRALLISQGTKTNPNLPKGVRTTLLNLVPGQSLTLSQAKVTVYDTDWDTMYTGYLLALHNPEENPWV